MKRCVLISLTLFLTYAVVLGQEQSVFIQDIRIKSGAHTIEDVFEQIRNKNFILSYNPKEVNVNDEITFSSDENHRIKELLTHILDKEKYNFVFVEKQRKILIIRKQRKFTLSGFIRERGSHESLIAASIFTQDYQHATSSNTYGFYSITLPEGEQKLRINYIGYYSKSLHIHLEENQRLDIVLEPSNQILNTIEIQATPLQCNQGKTKIDLLKSKPSTQILGTNDVLKNLQLLTGINGGLAGTSRLLVRGGKADNNLVLLDDVPLYNYNHFTGLISIFNSDALKHVDFYKGLFPARYGGRLSSIVDVRMREGDMKDFRGGGSVDMMTLSAFAEGPIKKDKASFLVNARRSWIDVFTILSKKENRVGFSLYDLNLKMNYNVDKQNKLFVSAYWGGDSFIDTYSNRRNDKDLSWGNRFVSMRWNHIFNYKTFINTVAYASEFDNQMASETGKKMHSEIKEFSLHSNIDYYQRYYQLHIGAKITSNQVRNGQFRQTNLGQVKTIQLSNYIENHIAFTKKLKLNAGLNYSFYNTSNTFFSLFDPRIQLAYYIRPNVHTFVGFSQMNQLFHQLSATGITFPYEIRLPSSEQIPPERAKMYEIGFSANTQNKKHVISANLYYNKQNNVLRYRLFQDVYNNKLAPDPNNQILKGKKNVYGIESTYKGEFRNIDVNISFSFSKAKEKFPQLNNEQFYTSPEHVEGILNTLLNWNINQRSSISANFVCNSGRWITLPTYSLTNNENQNIYFYNKLSNYQLPNNYQVNIGYSYRKVYSTKKMRMVQFGIYNLFSKPYPFLVDIEKTEQGLILNKTSMPYCIPYIKYSFTL